VEQCGWLVLLVVLVFIEFCVNVGSLRNDGVFVCCRELKVLVGNSFCLRMQMERQSSQIWIS
jgi:hypothetical protein